MRWALLLLALAPGLILAPAARAAEPLIADLTNHFIAITAGFTGTEVVLFGAVEGGGDIVVVVRGPAHDEVVRRKSKVAGLWINMRETTFAGVPSYYALYSNRPLAEFAPPAMQALHQMGLDHLHFPVLERQRTPQEIADFRSALIRQRQRASLFTEAPGRVSFLGDRLFRVTLAFPANLPTGEYHVDTYLVRDNAVVGAQSTPLTVSQAGLDAEVHDFADRQALLYGIIAVVGAAVAGWLASLPFRNA